MSGGVLVGWMGAGAEDSKKGSAAFEMKRTIKGGRGGDLLKIWGGSANR